MNIPMYSRNTQVMSRWKVAGALQSPCCIYMRYEGAKYGRERLPYIGRFDSNLFVHVRHIDLSSIFSSGYHSNLILVGEGSDLEGIVIPLPRVYYGPLLWYTKKRCGLKHCFHLPPPSHCIAGDFWPKLVLESFRASGKMIVISYFVYGSLWLTSLNGGSSRGMGPKSSEYFSNHCSRRREMSMGDMLGLTISPTVGDFVLVGLWAALDARNPRCGIGFCSRSEDTRDKSWLVASSSLDATRDCVGSTLVEPTISRQVAGNGDGATTLFRIRAVSRSGSRCHPDRMVFILLFFVEGQGLYAFTKTQRLPKSRHTP